MKTDKKVVTWRVNIRPGLSNDTTQLHCQSCFFYHYIIHSSAAGWWDGTKPIIIFSDQGCSLSLCTSEIHSHIPTQPTQSIVIFHIGYSDSIKLGIFYQCINEKSVSIHFLPESLFRLLSPGQAHTSQARKARRKIWTF